MPEGSFGLAEIEDEDRVIPIGNSHLSWGRCACGTRALFDPRSVRHAKCGTCLLAAAANATLPELPANWAKVPPLGQGHPPAPPVEREPYPEPEITSRGCWDATDAPRPVATLAGKARKAGWRVRAQRSRGYTPHASTGRPSDKIKDLYALIFTTEDGSASAYAVRDGAAWASIMLWGAELPWFPAASVTELEEYLAAQGRMPAAWYDAIRNKATRSAARTKLRAACNRGVHEKAHRRETDVWCEICGNAWPVGGEPWRAPKKGREGMS